jgi:hypothetical protein
MYDHPKPTGASAARTALFNVNTEVEGSGGAVDVSEDRHTIDCGDNDLVGSISPVDG